MNEKIDFRDYVNDINRALRGGILLNTQAEGRFNSMTIAWGMIGIEWNRPLFMTLVRTSRFSHELLEKNPEFTVSVPLSGKLDPELLKVTGRMSGRDVDKAKMLDLTLTPGEAVSVSAIKEVPLTLECKVIYKQDQDGNAIPKEILDRFYAGFGEADQDPDNAIHTMYFGEIVNAYIVR